MPKPKRSRAVRVGLIKAESAWGKPGENLEMMEDLLVGFEKRRLDVLISPEGFLDGYMVRDRKRCTPRKLARRCVRGPGDPLIRRVGRLAKRLRSWFVFGASEKDAAGVVRNAAYLLDRDGRPAGAYYKLHTCRFYTPGEALEVFETDFGKVGIVICADRRWPENLRCLRLKGAEIILNPTWGFTGDLNTAIMRTRAYENGLPVCFAHPRQSLICLPDGSVGAVLESSEPGVLVHEIDLRENVAEARTDERASSHPARNRRPELYGPIVAPT